MRRTETTTVKHRKKFIEELLKELREPTDGWSGDARAVSAEVADIAADEIDRLKKITNELVKILRSIYDESERPGARLNISINKYEGYREVPELLLENALAVLNGGSP